MVKFTADKIEIAAECMQEPTQSSALIIADDISMIKITGKIMIYFRLEKRS
jgi:hypothetical protein